MEELQLKDGGMLDLEGKEMDLRGGGFVPIVKNWARCPCKIKQSNL